MPTICCLPNCTSGYKTNFEIRHFFKVPTDAEGRNEWQQIVRRIFPDFELLSRHRLCDKHFYTGDILSEKPVKKKSLRL